MEERRYLEQQQQQQQHQQVQAAVRHREELSRRHQQAPDRLVQESIYKAFHREEERRSGEILNAPPQASRSKAAAAEKAALASVALQGYSAYAAAAIKDNKIQQGHRDVQYSLHHEKQSVIVQPESKYEKPHSISPKQRVPGRASPYNQPNLYKNYEMSPSPHRGSSGTPHQPINLNPSPHSVPSLAPSPHSIELVKAQRPQSSPHSSTSSPAHHERYYSSSKSPSASYQSPHPAHSSHPPLSTHPSHPQLSVHAQHTNNSSSHSMVSSHHQSQGHTVSSLPNSHTSRVSVSLVPNPHLVSQVSHKSKVNSPPPQVYAHPDSTRVPSQHIPHTKTPLTAPPPAHSGNRNHDRIPPPAPSHEHRTALIDRGTPYDARPYPPNVPSPHHKPLPTPVVTMPPTRSVPSVVQPTQTQPLDLGTRDDASSPNKRKILTPSPQDSKKPRLDFNTSGQPLLSKVSEPSALYSAALTTITSVENTAALSSINSRVNSPTPSNNGSSRPPSQPTASITPIPSRPDSTNSPGSNCASKSEPEKSNSPGPSGGCYVHKLKKAWLQRHESGAEISPPASSPSQSSRTTSPPPINTMNGGGTSGNGSNSNSGAPKSPSTSGSSSKSDEGGNKSTSWKPKTTSTLPNGHSQGSKDLDSTSTDTDDGSAAQKPKRGKGKRSMKRPKKSSDSNSESDKESDGSENSGKKSSRLSSKQDLEPKKRGRKPKSKLDTKEKEDVPKPRKLKEELVGDPLKKPPLHQLKKTGESFLQDGSCFEVSAKLPKCRECRWTAHQRNKKMPNIFCRFYAFRRLRYTKNGQLAVAGFSDSVKVSKFYAYFIFRLLLTFQSY